MFLEHIGADARVRELFRPHEAEGMELGRVSFAAHEQYRINLETDECEAAPAGRFGGAIFYRRWGIGYRSGGLIRR
jgi:hypothetical protein